VNEELSSFTHVASHDMKEPLRKILAFAGRIEDAGFDREKSREYVQKIVSSASGLQRLIDDLLSYSHVANDTSTFETVDLNGVLEAVRGDLEIAINEKKAVIESTPLPVVNGISYQLQQLFLNLLSNSIKFAKPDEPPRISITSEIIEGPDIPGVPTNGLNKYYHIAVSDNGIGFAQEYNRRIFEDKYPGTGIGLAIVKKIIQNHNGIISAEGAPDEGATFHLYLPA
jgi:signal transduction histidine kinase